MNAPPVTAPRDPAGPLDAATVVVLRDRPTGLEVYLVRRSIKSVFLGGVYVFPGGKVDTADADPTLLASVASVQAPAVLGLPSPLAEAHVVAAIRETLEEAGIWLGAPAEAEAISAVRDGLRAKGAFPALLADAGLHLDAQSLRYLSHWITPQVEPRRFSARFFLAPSPDGDHGGIDDHEIIHGAWFTPADAIARYYAADIDLAPPTLWTLMGLTDAQTVEAALAAAPHRPQPPLRPELAMEGGLPRLVLQGDPLHPSAPGQTPWRFELVGQRWRVVGGLT